jgi:hypothetical protein
VIANRIAERLHVMIRKLLLEQPAEIDVRVERVPHQHRAHGLAVRNEARKQSGFERRDPRPETDNGARRSSS